MKNQANNEKPIEQRGVYHFKGYAKKKFNSETGEENPFDICKIFESGVNAFLLHSHAAVLKNLQCIKTVGNCKMTVEEVNKKLNKGIKMNNNNSVNAQVAALEEQNANLMARLEALENAGNTTTNSDDLKKEIMQSLRDRFEELSGEKAIPQWKEETLRAKILELENNQ